MYNSIKFEFIALARDANGDCSGTVHWRIPRARVSRVYTFSILFCIFIRIPSVYGTIHIKSFSIFTFLLEISTEGDSFLRIGSKRRRIALSFSYTSLCRRRCVHPKRELAIVCGECTFIRRHRSQEVVGQLPIFLSVLRGIVFSVPRDNRHYPDTL